MVWWYSAIFFSSGFLPCFSKKPCLSLLPDLKKVFNKRVTFCPFLELTNVRQKRTGSQIKEFNETK